MTLPSRLPPRWGTGVLALLLVVVATQVLALPAHADAPVVTEYSVEPPQRLTVGDHVNVRIVIEADQGTQVQIAPGGIPDELALAESARFSTTNKGSGRIEVRIDLVLASNALSQTCSGCRIDKEPRGWDRPSDHVPVIAEFALP